MGLAMLMAQQLQNATLARYQNAVAELAAFALATGILMIFKSSAFFLPQMITVYARTQEGLSKCMRFSLVISAALALPMIWLTFTSSGGEALSSMFGLGPELLKKVQAYLGWQLPLLFVDNIRSAYVGLLVQIRRTGIVSSSNILYLVLSGVLLVVGFQAGLPAIATLVGSQLVASSAHMVLLMYFKQRYYKAPGRIREQVVTYRELARFFAPIAVTGAIFALSRPLVFIFLGRLEDPEPALAAVRVAFDFIMIFNNPMNQFRHVYVAFWQEDPIGVRRFTIYVVSVIVGIMLLLVVPSISNLVLKDILGLQGEVLRMTRIILLMHMIAPVLIAIRNYFHGIAMVRRRTGKIGVSSTARLLTIVIGGWVLAATGHISYWSMALVHVAAFFSETVVVWFLTRRSEIVIEEAAASIR